MTGASISPPPLDIREELRSLYAPILHDLQQTQVVFDREIDGDLPFVNELCSTVRSYRGKMLRPALLLLAAKACGRTHGVHHVLAAVVEMVHMATLVHDDVLDEADERRRQPTVNNIAGNEAAVLLGDYLISHSFHLCSSLESQYASRRIGATTNIVCEGELLQNYFRGRLDLTESQYFDIVTRKTAELTATACELGAHFVQEDGDDAREVVEALRRFGQSVGIAFQIVDDILDLTGVPHVVGKTLGRDACMGKLTLPMIHCIENGDRESTTSLKRQLERNENADRHQIMDCVNRTSSIDYATDVARRYINEAIDALIVLPESDAKDSLMTLAGFVVQRQI